VASPHSDLRLVQRLASKESDRFEGVSFAPSGDILAVAAPGENAVWLYRRGADGLIEPAPYSKIEELSYPHDVAFATCGSSELLAIAQRVGKISIWQRHSRNEPFTPAFDISGPDAGLEFTDGVAFLPDADYVVACNLLTGSLTFFKRRSLSPVSFNVVPDFVLEHESVDQPDGLAFSKCGRWLATANHGNHSVCVFRRRNRLFSAGKLRYGPNPVTVIKDPQLRYTHSVAFTPRSNDLVVTSAGANSFSVYQSRASAFGRRWGQRPRLRETFCDTMFFETVNSANKMEGGPKGIAIHETTVAVCSPEMGVAIYSLAAA
jgi:6-phosphogluconolactonase (cycloisomerase 2 family)